jgi:hypothetical protein
MLMARQFRQSQKKLLAELGETVDLPDGVCFQCKSASRFDMLECQEAGNTVKVHRLCLTQGQGKSWCPHHEAQVNCGGDADVLQQWRCGRHRQSEAALDSRVRESVDVYATSWQKQAYLDDDSDDDLPGLVSSSESSEAESDDDTEYRPVRTMRRSDRGVRRGDRRRNECKLCDANPCSEAQLPYEEADVCGLCEEQVAAAFKFRRAFGKAALAATPHALRLKHEARSDEEDYDGEDEDGVEEHDEILSRTRCFG